MTKYTLEYDGQADAAYIKISGSRIVKSREAGSGIILDVDKNGNLVGVEILNFSKSSVDLRELVTKQFDSFISVVE